MTSTGKFSNPVLEGSGDSKVNLLLCHNCVLSNSSISTRFGEMTEWADKPTVKVAVTVDASAIVKLLMDRLMDS